MMATLVPSVAGATQTTSTAPSPPDVFVAYSPITAQGSTLGADSVESFNTQTVESITNGGSSTGTFTGVTSSGSDTVTGIVATFTLTAGLSVTGAGIPSGTTISSVLTSTSVTLSADATATTTIASPTTLTVVASNGSAQVGAQPTAEAVSPDGGTVYVLNSASDNITPVSTLGAPEAQSPISLPAGYTPTALAITPNGADAYVTAEPTVSNSFAPALWEIVLTGNAAGTLAKTILLPSNSSPVGVALTPNGSTALVTNFSGGSVIVVNLLNGTVGSSIAVGPGPVGIAVSPNGNDAYVANSEGDSVSQIILATDSAVTPATSLDAGYSPQQVAISPDGSTLWVTEDNASSPGSVGFAAPVSIPDMTTGVPVTVGNDPYGIAITPDGTTAFVADETSLDTNAQGVPHSAGAISVVNTAAGTAQSRTSPTSTRWRSS